MTTSLEKLTWIVRRLIHQSGGDMHLVPNYPCWKLGKSTLSLDKRTFLSGINTNSLTPTWARLPLDPINHILTIFFAFTPLFSATYYIYSHPLLCHYWLSHWNPFGRYHTGATPLFVSYHVVSKHTFFSKVWGISLFYQTVSGFLLYTRARGAPVDSREKSYTNRPYVIEETMRSRTYKLKWLDDKSVPRT